MRFKLFRMVNTPHGDFYMFLGESKKRQYIFTANLDGKATGFRKFDKKKEEDYFLIYEIEELKKCGCKDCMKKLKNIKRD